ncbi:MAG: RNA methyltransferase [Cyanobacteriota bacterium]|nr:RNA methyltransferase [Cyanobacteriota bacterium]
MDRPLDRITSRRNPLVKQLRELHTPRGRRDQGLLLLEGTHLLQEVRRLQLQPRQLVATPAWLQAHPQLAEAPPHWPAWQPVSGEVLAAAASTEHPDGVVLTLAPPPPAPPIPAAAAPLLLVLDAIQDPGNLGTLMRTALAAGAAALWLAEGADPFQPKVLRASAGAALALPIWRGRRAELVERLQALLAQRVQLVATLPPQPGVRPYWQIDWRPATALLLGSEGAGLAPELQALAQQRVTIPHGGAVESLNVAVAAAPLLLERLRQERMPAN